MIDSKVIDQLKRDAQRDGRAFVRRGDLLIKFIPRNGRGNTVVIVAHRSNTPIAPATFHAWGAALGVPSGVEWRYAGDTMAGCEFPAPAAPRFVQP